MPLVFALTHAIVLEPAGRPVRRLRLVRAPAPGGVHRAAPRRGSPPTAASSSWAPASPCSAPSSRRNKVAAVVTMAVVGFAVLFAGIVAPQAATATTAALLTFVLPVAVAQPASAGRAAPGGLGDRRRLLHHGLHAGVAAPVARQPAPPTVAPPSRPSPAWPMRAPAATDDHAAYDDVPSELARLREQFSGTPYPPTGAAVGRRGALQARRPGGMGRRQLRDDPGRALVDRAAAGPGGHREGGRDAAPDRGADLRRRGAPGPGPGAHRSGAGVRPGGSSS